MRVWECCGQADMVEKGGDVQLHVTLDAAHVVGGGGEVLERGCTYPHLPPLRQDVLPCLIQCRCLVCQLL